MNTFRPDLTVADVSVVPVSSTLSHYASIPPLIFCCQRAALYVQTYNPCPAVHGNGHRQNFHLKLGNNLHSKTTKGDKRLAPLTDLESTFSEQNLIMSGGASVTANPSGGFFYSI
ncbi:MAG: hypothetical protein Q7U88_16560 [Desulfocapsaceae bacterium]|nr:hypothetical protein [Desulfocapsaceae bacterium]